MKQKYFRIYVDVPEEAPVELRDKFFCAVADAAYEAQPEDRGPWDVMVYTHGLVEEELPDDTGVDQATWTPEG